MTEPQRRTLRQLIDQARRERLRRERTDRLHDANQDARTETGERECDYCGQMFLVGDWRANAAKRRFCTAGHRASYHRRERMRREREWVATLKAKATLA